MMDEDLEYYMWKIIHDTIKRLAFEQQTNSIDYILSLIENEQLKPYEEKHP